MDHRRVKIENEMMNDPKTLGISENDEGSDGELIKSPFAVRQRKRDNQYSEEFSKSKTRVHVR